MSRILMIDAYPTFPAGRFGAAGALSLATRFLRRVAATINTWAVRHGTRRALAALEPHQLVDIGKTPAEARRESGKLFWQA
jgi:uncharacterized protein YjiS (DUF1127 family)